MKPPDKKHIGTSVPAVLHDAQVSALINQAARLTNKAARIRLGEVGAWPGQIPILLWLLEEDGQIQKDLLAKCNMEQSTMAEHLDRMESHGLIFRRRGADDKRKFRIYLTPKARAISGDLVNQLEAGARAFVKGIDEHDFAVFIGVLNQLIANVTAFVERPQKQLTRGRPKLRGGKARTRAH